MKSLRPSTLLVGTLATGLAVVALSGRAALPPGLGYVLDEGRGWIALTAALAVAAALAGRVPRRQRLLGVSARLLGAAARDTRLLGGIGFVLAVLLMPGWRWNAPSFGGDEPKYLRLTESLLFDLDVDVASRSLAPWSAGAFLRQLPRLVRDAGDALARLPGATETLPQHRWSRGNWTLNGLHGGQYYVQSPGLPLLLLPARIAQSLLAPERPDSFFPLLTLALFWAVALAQACRLAAEVSGSAVAGLVAGAAAVASAPLLVGGFHFYPESAAAALVPWLLRYARSGGPPLTRLGSAAAGLGCGFLPWLHPKFLLLAAGLFGMLAWRLRPQRARLAAAAACAALPVLALLLFTHHVTGLAVPDALYRRYGSSVYQGPAAFLNPLVLNGLVTALFGARDGLFVMAPVLLAGALAALIAWKHDARSSAQLATVFACLWLAAAVHEGGAPGPPGRLMAPVACVPAALLAVGLRTASDRPGFTLTAAALVAVSVGISVGMLSEWRRTVNPYRDVFAAADHDFARDLPDGPGRAEPARPSDKVRDRGRGLFLAGLIGAWAWAFGRSDDRPGWNAGTAFGWFAGFWVTLATASWGVWALAP